MHHPSPPTYYKKVVLMGEPGYFFHHFQYSNEEIFEKYPHYLFITGSGKTSIMNLLHNSNLGIGPTQRLHAP